MSSRRGSRGRPAVTPACFTLALVLAASAFTPSALRAAPTKIVLVSIDGLPAGAETQRERMPALAALAGAGAHGVACSPAAVPFPAWAELLTGCGPGRTLVWDEHTRGLGEKPPTLAASLRTLGYRGLGVPCDPLAHAASGLARGFERYSPDAPAWTDSARVDSALVWLRAPGRRFAWLSLSFGAPAESWRRSDGIGPRDPAAFAARARELDAALAQLVAGLARAGLSGTTLLAVSGTGSVPGASPGVPVVLRVAGGPAGAGRALRASASLADVAPTLVAAAGGSAAGFDGGDLLALPAKPARAEARACVPAGGREGADAMAVPDSCFAELSARIARGAVDSVAIAGWDSLLTRCPGSVRMGVERDMALSRAGREKLASNGLKAAAAALPDDPRPAIAYADHLLRSERGDIVPDVLKHIERQNPFAALVQWRLAIAYAGQKDFLAAEGAARRAAAMASPTADAIGLPALFRRFAVLADSVSSAPLDAGLHLRYGRALGDFGLFLPAYEQFHAARGLAGASAEPDYWLAVYLSRQGRPQHAVPTLQRALEHEPDYLPARLALADAFLDLGRRREAREQLERVQASLGGDSRALYNLACLRATDGETPDALDALERAMRAGYADSASLATDHDLDTLRTQPRFRALLDRR